MSESLQPLAGALSARIIRACPVHGQCALECPERVVEELGTLAHFDRRPWTQRVRQWLTEQRKGPP